MATSDGAFAALAASWRRQLDAVAALGSLPTVAGLSPEPQHIPARSSDRASSSGDSLHGGMDGDGGSSGASETASAQQSPNRFPLRAPAMVHPGDAAAVEAAILAGMFLETTQPPWRGARPEPRQRAALTILVRHLPLLFSTPY